MNEIEEMKLKAEIKQIDVETLIKLENHKQELKFKQDFHDLKVKEKEIQMKWIFWRNLIVFLVSVISMIGGAMQLYSTYFK